jgi:hypothetical protein
MRVMRDALARRCAFAVFAFDASAPLENPNLHSTNRIGSCASGWIASTVLDGRRVLHVTLMSPHTSEEHVILLIDGLAEEAQRLL